MPSKGVYLKVIPYSITEFAHEYDIETDNVGALLLAYSSYLSQNSHQHHYDHYETQEFWLISQVNMYIEKQYYTQYDIDKMKSK